MAAHARLKNEFMEDVKNDHNLMRWLGSWELMLDNTFRATIFFLFLFWCSRALGTLVGIKVGRVNAEDIPKPSRTCLM